MWARLESAAARSFCSIFCWRWSGSGSTDLRELTISRVLPKYISFSTLLILFSTSCWKIAYVISILLCHNLMRRRNGEWKSPQNLIFLPLWQAINHVAEEKAFSDFGLTNAVILGIGYHITGHNVVFDICTWKYRNRIFKNWTI